MPKKTLRGKRYIRARKIVSFTRLKKRQKKFNKAVVVISFNLKKMMPAIRVAFQNATEMINARIEELKREAR